MNFAVIPPLLCLALATPPGELQPPAAEALSTRVYDVRELQPPLSDEYWSVALLPYLRDEVEWDPDHDLLEILTSLIQDVVAPEEFEYEARWIEGRDTGWLYVTAPQSVQDDVSRLLDHLRASFRRDARLRVTVSRVREGPPVGAALDARSLAELERSGRLERVMSRTERISLAHTEHRGATAVQHVVRGWDGEIAQSSAIGLPRVGTLRTGLDMLWRLEESGTGSGYRLRWIHRLSEIVDEGGGDINQWSTTVLDARVDVVAQSAYVDRPRVALVTLGGSRLLDVGGEVIDAAWTSTGSGEVAGYVVQAQLEAVAPRPEPIRFEGRTVRTLDHSAFAWPPLRVPSLDGRALRPGDGLEGHRFGDDDVARVGFPSQDFHGVPDDFPALERLGWEDGGYWSVYHWSILAGRQDVVERAVDELTRYFPEHRDLVVEVGLSESGAEGDALALCRLNVETGAEAFAIVGEARSMHTGYDADVATAASMTDPEIVDVVDGLSVRARAEGRDEAVLEIFVHRLGELVDVPLADRGGLSLQRPRFHVADLSVRLPADGRRHVVGGLSAGDASPRPVIWARISDG